MDVLHLTLCDHTLGLNVFLLLHTFVLFLQDAGDFHLDALLDVLKLLYGEFGLLSENVKNLMEHESHCVVGKEVLKSFINLFLKIYEILFPLVDVLLEGSKLLIIDSSANGLEW